MPVGHILLINLNEFFYKEQQNKKKIKKIIYFKNHKLIIQMNLIQIHLTIRIPIIIQIKDCLI